MFVAPKLDPVVSGLGTALGRSGYDVTIVAPLAAGDVPDATMARRIEPLAVGDEQIDVYDGALSGGRAHLFQVATKNPCSAAVALAVSYDRWPAIVHAFGLPTLPALTLATDIATQPAPATVASVGRVHADGAETGEALSAADRIVTASESYADALCTEAVSGRLAAAFGAARPKLRGVPHGLDTVRWNPKFDPGIAARFSADDLAGKRACKRALQRELGLPRRPHVPVIAVVGDLGSDLVCGLVGAGDDIAHGAAQLVFHGPGEPAAAQAAVSLAARLTTRVAAQPGSDPELIRRAAAGADFYVIPDSFDPELPNQLYCARYGAVPVVRADSGLTDGLVDYDDDTGTGNALLIDDVAPPRLAATVRRMERAYARPEFDQLTARVMGFDLSWSAAARRYAAVYDELV